MTQKKTIESRLGEDDVAVDVGANPKGGDHFASTMADVVGEGGLVIAFDPFPIDAFWELDDEYDQVVCVPEAVVHEPIDISVNSDHVGGVRPHDDASYSGGIPLDVVSYADLAKIDVEGWEYSVVKSGSNLLRRSQPTLIIELHEWKEKKDGWTDQLFGLLIDHGYRIEYNGDNISSVDEVDGKRAFVVAENG